MSAALQVMSTTGQAHILDGGFDGNGERRQFRIDPRAVGTLPDWAASLPVLHRLVARGKAKVLSGELTEPKAPNTEPPPKAAANNDALVMQLTSLLAGLTPDQRAQVAAAITAVK